MNIGDRFEWCLRYISEDVHKCEYLGCGKFKVLVGRLHGQIVHSIIYLPDQWPEGWVYLGNFGKSNNFTSLWSILSE